MAILHPHISLKMDVLTSCVEVRRVTKKQPQQTGTRRWTSLVINFFCQKPVPALVTVARLEGQSRASA